MTLPLAVERESKLIINLTRGIVVCEDVVIADRPLRRMRGLLGRQSLPAGEGMLLEPVPSIHTAFMRFPIDVILMDGTLGVLKIVEELPPWRAASAHRARVVLELAAGEVARRGVAVSDQLGVVEVTDRLGAVGSSPSGNGVDLGMPLSRAAADSSDVPLYASAEPTPITAANSGWDTIRVLIIGHDRRFRSVAAVLLTRRGCAVTLGAPGAKVAELVYRERPDVVLLEVGESLTGTAQAAAQIETLNWPLGLVIVGEESDVSLSAMPVLPKWGSFDELYGAIERARQLGARSVSHGSCR